ncbi:hypothetical protein FS749_003079 [Ceratobasidium sp. UAMH 11750]|nr:hypothetical protein FS749_003079 [Ceratobasidium sp. UAMH 11750]
MRFTSYALVIASVLFGSGTVSSLSINPKLMTAPRHLYSLSLTFTDNYSVAGPLGTRVGLGITGGNMTAPNGSLIGKVVPGVGGETGVIDKNGNLEIDAKAVCQFLDDNKYAYMAISGIGLLNGRLYNAHHFETDSSSRLAWNSYYIVTNTSFDTPTHAFVDAFYWSTSS